MIIYDISKKEQRVTISLDASELVELCNILYEAQKEKDMKPLFYELYGNLMMLRDLSQYGHIDDFCFKHIAKCREKISELRESEKK